MKQEDIDRYRSLEETEDNPHVLSRALGIVLDELVSLQAAEQFKAEQDAASSKVAPGRYIHFKGGEYDVIYTVVHSETRETFVLYRPCYGARLMTVRPLSMWSEHVERDGYSGPRFRPVDAARDGEGEGQ